MTEATIDFVSGWIGGEPTNRDDRASHHCASSQARSGAQCYDYDMSCSLGFSTGIAGVVGCHPFDTVKVKIHNHCS